MKPLFFCYTFEDGIQFFNTAKEAEERAEEELDFAHEMWDEYADAVCWGEVRAKSAIVESRPAVEGDGPCDGDRVVDYVLVPCGGPNETPA